MSKDTEPSPGSDFSALPSFESYHTDQEGRPFDVNAVYGSFRCEGCEKLSPYVIGYSLPMMFFWPGLFRFDEMVKCRRCMRWHIITRMPLMILLAHIFSPIFILWWLLVFLQTFYKRPF